MDSDNLYGRLVFIHQLNEDASQKQARYERYDLSYTDLVIIIQELVQQKQELKEILDDTASKLKELSKYVS